jgi:hypothetical protein
VTDEERIARKEADFDAGRFRHDSRYCRTHDERIVRDGRCPECYRADEEYAEYERDCLHLWRTR